MSRITVGQENSGPIDLYYEDHGEGPPVVLLHGWPLSSITWEKQAPALLAGGCRVLSYDRRGFGESSRPAWGYDYDTLAADLNQFLLRLGLREVALVGSSLGSGEIVRYLSRYGSERVRCAVLLNVTPPEELTAMQADLTTDRLAFLSRFLEDAYNFDVLEGKGVSRHVLQAYWNVAAGASAQGTRECLRAWGTDLRADLARVKVPTLVVHGGADRIGGTPQVFPDGGRLLLVEDAPHGLLWTHADQVNGELLNFLS